MKILVIEDDVETADFVQRGLREIGYDVAAVHNGQDGLTRACAENWDIFIVDRMLPGIGGFQVVTSLRARQITGAILFLTTLGGIDDRVSGLNAGADDYLTKPFAFAELAARVAALGRRSRTASPELRLRIADLELDLLAHTVRRGTDLIDLQPREYRLLEYLMRHLGQVVTRTMLLENVWDLYFDPHTNVVETHISRLRAKIDRGRGVPLISTVRGFGYSISAAS
jgi:two-component system OmpR family response regulator